MNEHGEFVTQADFDPEERRATVYASLRAIDPKRFRKSIEEDPDLSDKPGKLGVVVCEECGAKVKAKAKNQIFCSIACQRANYNRKRRKRK